MNDFHKKVMEARIRESNWKWIVQRTALVIAAVLFLLAMFVFMFSPTGSKDSAAFTMVANGNNDTFAVTNNSKVKEGYYRAKCTAGHGLLNLDDISNYYLAADEQKGKKMSDQTYAQTATVFLGQGDTLCAYGYGSSKFRLEFHYIGETLE